jgi:hypothetical protein
LVGSKNIIYIKLQLYPCFYLFSENFENVMKQTTLHQRIPFDMDGEFVRLYFGKEKSRQISYSEFSQFLHVTLHTP